MDSQNVKQYAHRIVKYCFGLNLYTSERVRLNHCVDESLEMLAKIESARHRFNPADEAVMRFLHYNFEVPFAYDPALQTINGVIDEPFCEYLRREHAKQWME